MANNDLPMIVSTAHDYNDAEVFIRIKHKTQIAFLCLKKFQNVRPHTKYNVTLLQCKQFLKVNLRTHPYSRSV